MLLLTRASTRAVRTPSSQRGTISTVHVSSLRELELPFHYGLDEVVMVGREGDDALFPHHDLELSAGLRTVASVLEEGRQRGGAQWRGAVAGGGSAAHLVLLLGQLLF